MNDLQPYQQPAIGRLKLPTAGQLSYAKDALELFVLLLALPYLLRELLHDPARLTERMAGHQALT